MKKLLAFLLAIIMVFAFAACNDDNGEGGGGNGGGGDRSNGGGGSNNNNSGGNDNNPGGDDINDAISQINDYLQSLGLEEDEYGFTQYGEWNADLLPDCVPAKPSGVIAVDRTEYKDKNHEDQMASWTGSYGVGNLSFPDKRYERHLLMFTCTPDALNEFVNGIETNGFKGGLYDIDPNDKSHYEWLGNGYYAHMISYASWDDENEISVELNLTPTLNPLPKTFQGTPLPDFGLVMDYEEFGGWGMTGDNDFDGFWDKYNDSGNLPEYWNIWYEYDFVTLDDARAYVQKLVSDGWEIVYDGDGTNWDDQPTYYAQLKKGNVYAAVDAPYDGSGIAVRFGTDAESLYY